MFTYAFRKYGHLPNCIYKDQAAVAVFNKKNKYSRVLRCVYIIFPSIKYDSCFSYEIYCKL